MEQPWSTPTLSDADLVRRVAEGETGALELLYDRSAWFVYANALRMLHDPSLAQDLVPEVFLSFWRWQASYQNAWSGWQAIYLEDQASITMRLLAITRNLASHQYSRRHYSPESRFANGSDIAGSVREETIRQATLRVAVAEAMDWLPASQRHVIELRAVQGLTAQNVAERLAESPDAVNDLMSRAIRNLQHSIGFEPEEIAQILAPTIEETDRLQSAKETLIAEVEAYLRRSRSENPPPDPVPSPEPSIAEIVGYLRDALGPRLTALIVGVTDARDVANWASGKRRPTADIEQRLREAFGIVQLLLQVESPRTVRSWFLGMNPELDDRAPALVLAREPEIVAEAARTFVANG